MIATTIFALILFYCLLVLWSLFKMAGQSDTTFPGCADSAPVRADDNRSVQHGEFCGAACNIGDTPDAFETDRANCFDGSASFMAKATAANSPQPVAQTSTRHRLFISPTGWILAGSGGNEPLAPHCQVSDETANWDNFPRYEF